MLNNSTSGKISQLQKIFAAQDTISAAVIGHIKKLINNPLKYDAGAISLIFDVPHILWFICIKKNSVEILVFF